MVPRSLSGRLLSTATILIVLALSATGVAMDFALRRFIQGQIDGRLDGQILSVTDALRIGADGSLGLTHLVDGPPFERPLSGWYWAVVGIGRAPRSQSLGSGTISIVDPLPGDRARPVTLVGTGPGDERLRVRAKRVQVGAEGVTILATAPLQALTDPLHDILAPLIVALVLLGAALLAGVLLQVRFGLRPLARLRTDLASVVAGGKDRIGGPQPSEIAPLVDELNILLVQNAANLERARRHVANLAHGLKTPLATLALALEETACDPTGRLLGLVGVMDKRIRHHLTRARTAALGGGERSRVLLATRLADHVAVFSKLYADKKLAIVIDARDDVTVACEAQDLDEVLGNLLDNSCKWACGQVKVTAASAEGRVTLDIEDDGPGLTSDQALKVLRPGLRLDESAPGHGFGLPIARELTELYGGTFELRRSELGGVKAHLDLPAGL